MAICSASAMSPLASALQRNMRTKPAPTYSSITGLPTRTILPRPSRSIADGCACSVRSLSLSLDMWGVLLGFDAVRPAIFETVNLEIGLVAADPRARAIHGLRRLAEQRPQHERRGAERSGELHGILIRRHADDRELDQFVLAVVEASFPASADQALLALA